MIVNLFRNPRVVYQTPDEEFGIAEPAIGASLDGSGLIVLEQAGNTLLLNRASVPELCKSLRELAKEGGRDDG